MNFRVKTGYGKSEFFSIEESELTMAINAQLTGKVAIFKTGTIAGNHIMSIKPDWNKAMSYNADYEMTGEDMAQIPYSVKAKLNLAIENAGETVKAKIENRPPVLKAPQAVRINKGMTELSKLLPKE